MAAVEEYVNSCSHTTQTCSSQSNTGSENSYNNDSYSYNITKTTPPTLDEFVLEHVDGVTTSCHQSLASNSNTGQVAYPSACMLVLLTPQTGEQRFIEAPTATQNITCVAFSPEGKLVGFGESGINPFLSVWLVHEFRPLNQFQIGYQNSVRAIEFHPGKPYIVVLGKMEVCVFDFLRGDKLAFSKWTTIPLAMTIPREGGCVMICGHRKITSFNLEDVNSMERHINSLDTRRCVTLGCKSDYTFVDIKCGKGHHDKVVYVVTSCGYLCRFKLGGVLIEKSEKIDQCLTSVRYGLELLFVGCADGMVKICSPDDLRVAAAISLKEMLGPEIRPSAESTFGITTSAIAISEKQSIVTCIYSDFSIYSWQVKGTAKAIECTLILPLHFKKRGSGDTGRDLRDSALSWQLYRIHTLKQLGAGLSTPGNKVSRSSFGNLHDISTASGCLELSPSVLSTAVQMSRDGQHIISGDHQGEIKVYDQTTGAIRRVIEAHTAQVTCVELMYDEDVKFICSGGRDRVIFVLDASKDFSLVQVLCDHHAAISAISLTRQGQAFTLISSAVDGVILVRSCFKSDTMCFQITGQVTDLLHGSCGLFTTSPGGLLAAGIKNGDVNVFKMNPVLPVNKPVKVIQSSKYHPPSGDKGLKSLAIDPSGSFLAIGSYDGNTSVYHLQTCQIVATLSNQRNMATMKFTSDLAYLISTTGHLNAFVWKLPQRMSDYMAAKLSGNTDMKYDTTKAERRHLYSRAGAWTPSAKSPNLQHSQSFSSITDGPVEGDRKVYACSSFTSCSSYEADKQTDRPGVACTPIYSTSESLRMNSLPNASLRGLLDKSKDNIHELPHLETPQRPSSRAQGQQCHHGQDYVQGQSSSPAGRATPRSPAITTSVGAHHHHNHRATPAPGTSAKRLPLDKARHAKQDDEEDLSSRLDLDNFEVESKQDNSSLSDLVTPPMCGVSRTGSSRSLNEKNNEATTAVFDDIKTWEDPEDNYLANNDAGVDHKTVSANASSEYKTVGTRTPPSEYKSLGEMQATDMDVAATEYKSLVATEFKSFAAELNSKSLVGTEYKSLPDTDYKSLDIPRDKSKNVDDLLSYKHPNNISQETASERISYVSRPDFTSDWATDNLLSKVSENSQLILNYRDAVPHDTTVSSGQPDDSGHNQYADTERDTVPGDLAPPPASDPHVGRTSTSRHQNTPASMSSHTQNLLRQNLGNISLQGLMSLYTTLDDVTASRRGGSASCGLLVDADDRVPTTQKCHIDRETSIAEAIHNLVETQGEPSGGTPLSFPKNSIREEDERTVGIVKTMQDLIAQRSRTDHHNSYDRRQGGGGSRSSIPHESPPSTRQHQFEAQYDISPRFSSHTNNATHNHAVTTSPPVKYNHHTMTSQSHDRLPLRPSSSPPPASAPRRKSLSHQQQTDSGRSLSPRYRDVVASALLNTTSISLGNDPLCHDDGADEVLQCEFKTTGMTDQQLDYRLPPVEGVMTSPVSDDDVTEDSDMSPMVASLSSLQHQDYLKRLRDIRQNFEKDLKREKDRSSPNNESSMSSGAGDMSSHRVL